jgi:nitrogen regulatory protein PII
MGQTEEKESKEDRAEPEATTPTRGRPFQVIALVKPFRAQAVLSALQSIDILGGTVREAMGYGRQKNRLRQYLGSEYNTSFLPKVELTVFVEEGLVSEVVRVIVSEARTGRIGDGKILVLPCLDLVFDA